MSVARSQVDAIFVVMAGLVIFSSLLTYMMSREALQATQAVTENQRVLGELERTISLLKDAETGQRGYLLTSDDTYLRPYEQAVPEIEGRLGALEAMAVSTGQESAQARQVRQLARQKLDELAKTIELRKTQGLAPALDLVKSNRGIELMDEIRQAIREMEQGQKRLLLASEEATGRAGRARNWAFGLTLAVSLLFLNWSYRRVAHETRERQAAAAETARQRELYALTLGSIDNGVITTDPQSRITLINPAAAALAEIPPEVARGMKLAEAVRFEREQTGETLRCPTEQVLAEGKSLAPGEGVMLVRRDGVRVPVELSAFPKVLGAREGRPGEAAGAALGVVVTLRDLGPARRTAEELRRNNERLTLVLEAAGLGTFDYDVPMDHARWDGTIARQFFTDPVPRVPFAHVMSRIHPEDRERVQAALDRAREQRVRYEVEYRTVAPEGYQTGPGEPRVRWIQAIGRFYYEAGGTPMRFSGITMDVTARRLAELELLEANNRAERARSAAEQARQIAENAGRAKDQFLAALSHELRTPLTPVLATLSSLEQSASLDPELRDMVSTMRRNVDLEARLIDDLLDLTRVVQGKLALEAVPIDAHETLRQAGQIVQSEVNARSIDVEVRLEAARHWVMADATRLEQVFWNILRNAAKFSPEQEGRVSVRTFNDDAGNLVAEFADNGIGMTPEVIGRLFRPFEQGSDVITRRFGGLGLGLAISKALVERQGGTITATSKGVGRGSTFTVTLPTVVPAEGSNGRAVPGGAVHGRALRVLLVEDHADTARTMTLLLRRYGHTVVTAHTAGEALEAARESALAGPRETFDLILSDVGLPDMTGLDLIREIRKFSKTPAIALTGFGMEEDVARTTAAGFDAHLTKPVNVQRLRATMQQVAG